MSQGLCVARAVFIPDKLGRPDILGPLQILAVDTNRTCTPVPEMSQQKIPRYSPQPGTPERYIVRVRYGSALKCREESILRQILGGGGIGAEVTQVPVNGCLVFSYEHCQRFAIQVQASLPQQPVLLKGCAAMKKGCRKLLLISCQHRLAGAREESDTTPVRRRNGNSAPAMLESRYRPMKNRETAIKEKSP